MSTDALPWAAFNSDQDEIPTREQLPKDNVLRYVYLARRRPCWLCSRSLATVTAGLYKGQYAGAVIESQGHEHIVHIACARSAHKDD